MEYALKSILLTEILMGFSVVALIGYFVVLLRKLKSEGHPLLLLGLILLVALGLRAVWIANTQPVPESDFNVYWDYANRIYNGNLEYDVIERHPGIVLLYTFSFYLLGASLTTGWILNLVFSAAFLLVLYKLTQELFGRTVGLLAMAFGAILPQLITYSALMASEIPAVTFFLMIIWAFLQTREHTKQRLFYWAGMGLLLYGAVMVRSTSLLLLGLIPMTVLIARRDQLKPSLKGCTAMIVTAVLLISTWVSHQYLITGVAKLFYGDELWLAFTTQYDHGGSVSSLENLPYYKKYLAAQDGTMQGRLRSYQVLKEESVAIIKADPLKYLSFGFVRMQGILWNARTGIVWSAKASSVFPENNKVIRRLTEISTHIWRVLLILAPLGLLALFRPLSRVSFEGQLLIWMFLLLWLVFHFLVAVASERYAFQIIPFVLMMASSSIISILNSLNLFRSQGKAISTQTSP